MCCKSRPSSGEVGFRRRISSFGDQDSQLIAAPTKPHDDGSTPTLFKPPRESNIEPLGNKTRALAT